MLASHADVLTGSSRNHSSRGVGTRDEPPRTFAWEANIVRQFFIPLYHPPPLLLAHQVHLRGSKITPYSVILLQIVMVSHRTHLEKNHEFKSGTNESQLKKKETSPKWKMIWPLCNQTVTLKTDYKTLYYSILTLKYTSSI